MRVERLTIEDEEARLRQLQEQRRQTSRAEDGKSGFDRLQISSSDVDALKRGAVQAWEDRPKINMASFAGAAMHSLKTAPKRMIRVAGV